jgi:hypothetical protein
MPLGHLIALISNAHLRKPDENKRLAGASPFLLLLGTVNTAYRKTSLHRDRPNLEPAVERARSHGIGLARRGASTALRKPMPRDDADGCPASRAYPFFTMSRNPPRDAAELRLFDVGRHLARSRPGGARRDRTDDLLLAKQALSQLSYGPFR